VKLLKIHGLEVKILIVKGLGTGVSGAFFDAELRIAG
jgi:hypothetical protein